MVSKKNSIRFKKVKRAGKDVWVLKDKYRKMQTGRSFTSKDRKLKAKAPGKRRAKSGRVYTERRKNRSDKKGSRI